LGVLEGILVTTAKEEEETDDCENYMYTPSDEENSQEEH